VIVVVDTGKTFRHTGESSSLKISHAGQFYERDLGPESATKAQAAKSFDPGPGWIKVPDRDSE
jgi:hypothetical protein